MKNLALFVIICAGQSAALFAASFDSIAKELAAPDVRAALRGINIAITTSPDPVSADFAEAFKNVIKKDATVVFTDRSITKQELRRQESGLVDDKEVARYGYEKGAEIVVQLILYRIKGETKIKFILNAVWVESNSLAASNSVIKSVPSSYNTSSLPLQGEDPATTVKNAVNAIIGSHVKGIYDDPVKPPKEPFNWPKLPQINWSALKRDAWAGGSVSYIAYLGEKNLYGLKLSFEYGRDFFTFSHDKSLKDRWATEISLIIFDAYEGENFNAGTGLDINAGYQLVLINYDTYNRYDVIYDEPVAFSLISSIGFSLLTPNAVSNFIPYIQVGLSASVFYFSARWCPFSNVTGVSGGLGLKWAL